MKLMWKVIKYRPRNDIIISPKLQEEVIFEMSFPIIDHFKKIHERRRNQVDSKSRDVREENIAQTYLGVDLLTRLGEPIVKVSERKVHKGKSKRTRIYWKLLTRLSEPFVVTSCGTPTGPLSIFLSFNNFQEIYKQKNIKPKRY